MKNIPYFIKFIIKSFFFFLLNININATPVPIWIITPTPTPNPVPTIDPLPTLFFTETQKLLITGYSLSISGDIAVIGAVDDNSAYIFEKVGGIWTQTQKLVGSDVADHNNFGCSVFILGNTAIIGDRGDDEKGENSGAAYVFKQIDGLWTQTQKLVASDGNSNKYFGCAISISGDTALIGACGSNYWYLSSGPSYIFEEIDGIWTEKQKLLANDIVNNYGFGCSVSISGNKSVIGDCLGGTGSAYIFEKIDGIWTQTQKLLANDGINWDLFGTSVSISENTVIVGSHGNDNNGTDTGAAYIFEKNDEIWTQTQKIMASDSNYRDYFGWSVSISNGKAVIGAFGEDVGRGSAYIFEKINGTWIQTKNLLASDGTGNDDLFGYSVSISGDITIIGAINGSSVYVFDLSLLPTPTPTPTVVPVSLNYWKAY